MPGKTRRLDTRVRPETRKLLDLAKAEMQARSLDEVLYWLARIYLDACRRSGTCEPEKLYKKLVSCIDAGSAAIIVR